MTIQTKRELGALARALYNNTPDSKNELLFRKGEILTVIEYDYEGQPGWWLCALRGQRGICPSNYLELLEDKYSLPHKNVDGGREIRQDESLLEKKGTSEAALSSSTTSLKSPTSPDFVNPLETYDFPRSVSFSVPAVNEDNNNNKSTSTSVVNSGGERGSSSSILSSSISSLRTPSAVSPSASTQSIAAPTETARSSSNLSLSQLHHQQHIYSNEEPLYENDSVVDVDSKRIKEEKENDEQSFLTKTSPLDLYDVPRNELPIYGQSITRLRKYGSCTGADELSNDSSNNSRVRFALPSQSSTLRGRSVSSLGLSSSSTTSTTGVQLRRPPRYQPPQMSNRSSVQSESAESGIGMMSSSGQHQQQLNHYQNNMQTDLYDVPRGTATPVSKTLSGTNGGNSYSSRPTSALSMTSSGMGMSIATSDSKDSLDCLYDVPRNSSLSMKTYVNHMETKYDDVMAARTRSRHDSSSSTSSFKSQPNPPPQQQHNGTVRPGHSRHNSNSSIFSAYGYTRKQNSMEQPPSLNSSRHNVCSATSSVNGSVVDPLELYDVPRGTCMHPPHPPPPRPSTRCSTKSSSNGSIYSNQQQMEDDNDPMQFYDVPSQFARKVTLENKYGNGASSSSLASSSASTSISQSYNCHQNRPFSSSFNHRTSTNSLQQKNASTNSLCNGTSSSNSHINGGSIINGGSSGRKLDESDVKLLPLGPKAAVSVCDKLRQEIVSSIAAILSHVKPKWRTKENLTEIMPDLKFSCTRLCLAIKDVADFATRSLTNAKRLPEENVAVRLHRLLTPVINGSQIIQRDVDELDAYFWSVDRLSVTGGDSAVTSTASTSDALDQLILCSRSLKHDVTELANFLALHSTALYKENEHQPQQQRTSSIPKVQAVHQNLSKTSSSPLPVVPAESKVEDTQEDYDYVSLVPSTAADSSSALAESDSDRSNSVDSQKLSSALSSASSTSTVSWHLDSRDEQLLEFYSAQISVTAPQLSQSIATFISAIQQNEPPSVFNIHLKYVILLGYKLLFAADTVHRNIGNSMLKEEVELKANDLHKSILALYEASKVATAEFPKIGPMQIIVDRVWGTTQAATQLKKCIFNAVYTSV